MDVKQETIRLRRATTVSRMDVEPRDLTEVRNVVRGHMVRGIYLTPDFRDEQVYCIHNSYYYFDYSIAYLFKPLVAGDGR